MEPYILDQDEYMFHYCLVECAHEELDLKLSCEQSSSNSDTLNLFSFYLTVF